MGRNDYDFFPRDVAEAFQADDRQVMESGKIKDIEERYVAGDQYRWAHTIKAPVRDDAGNVTAVLGFFEDITERKQEQEELKAANQQLQAGEQQLRAANQQLRATEQQLRASNEQLRATDERLHLALSAADMGTWRWVPSTNRDTRDGSFNRILGLEPVESTQPVEDFVGRVHPDDRPSVEQAIESAARERKTYVGEFRIVRPNGEIHWLYDRGIGTYDEQGKMTYMTGAVVDITARKREEEALKATNQQLEASNQQLSASEQQLRALNQQLYASEKELEKHRRHLETLVEERTAELRLQGEVLTHIAEGIYLIRRNDGIIVHTNPKFEQMFGYGPGEMIGKHVAIVNAPTEKGPEETVGKIMGILDRTGEWHGEVNNVRKDGTPFWCHANVSLFEHPEFGEVLISVHTDITKRKRAEDELKEREARQRTIVNAMAGREVRMAELKGAIGELRAQLEEAGMTPVADDPM